MSDIDISSMDAAQKLAWAQAVGSVLLDSGSASAAASIDLDLPAGYSSFQLRVQNTSDQADGDFLCAIVSSDGGLTWHISANDYIMGDSGNGTFTDNLLYLQQYAPMGASWVVFDFFPGDGTAPFTGNVFGTVTSASASKLSASMGGALTSSNARQNKLRLQNYGDGTTTPPVGHDISSILYTLIGYA